MWLLLLLVTVTVAVADDDGRWCRLEVVGKYEETKKIFLMKGEEKKLVVKITNSSTPQCWDRSSLQKRLTTNQKEWRTLQDVVILFDHCQCDDAAEDYGCVLGMIL